MISLYFWVDYVDILFYFKTGIYSSFDDSTVIKLHKIRNNY